MKSQSPFRCNWKTDGTITGSNLCIAVAAISLDHHQISLTIQEVDQLSRQSINWFDRNATYKFSEEASKASDILVGFCLSSPLILFSDRKIREDWAAYSLMYVETIGLALSVPSIGKGSIKRIRPYAYNPVVPIEMKTNSDARRSFFSRHATLAFSSAVFVSAVYSSYYPNSEWNFYIWSGSLLTASVTSYLRYEAGEHFPSDLVMGAAVGSAIGYLIPFMHKDEYEKFTLRVVPGMMGKEVYFRYNF